MSQLISVSNPIYSNAQNTIIDCLIVVSNYPDPLPFTASPNDVEAHGREIYARLIAGDYGPIAPYVPPPNPSTPKSTGTQPL